MNKENNKKKLHVIGLCGKGTSAVALLMQQSGWEISGSDAGMYEPVASYLKSKNLTCQTPYSPANIPDSVDMILMGSSATLDPKINAEVARAYKMNIPIKSFAEILSDLTEKTENIVVAGSYGKSTCTSLLSHYLSYNNKKPSYFIGAVPLSLDSSSKIDSGEYFILEGDEYPYKFDDMRSKFMFYHTKTLLLTSGEHDHVNKFPTIESYLAPYKDLVSSLSGENLIICAINHPYVDEIISNSVAGIITYGFENADYTVGEILFGPVTGFNIYKNKNLIGKFETQLLGKHNIENILGTVALVLEKGILSIPELQKTVRSFTGIKRRLDLKTKSSLVPVYEGFGSSYTKAKTAIDAMRLHFPDRKLITIFEPHTFGWRNRANLDWYHDVFDGSEAVFIYKPPTHGAESHQQLSKSEIVHEIKKFQENIFPVSNSDETIEYLKNILDESSIILMLSSGDLGGMIQAVPEFCDKEFKKQ